ncbi:transposase [Paraburkholderia strydomiana]|uniref:transposase n=1 Tax=Paraburkholderia strydomiana TaxID=1245417 RepID=UPI0038BB7231
MDERLGVEQRLRELDRLGEGLHEVDQALAQASIGDERLRRLLTITGVNTIVAIGLLSAIGDVGRFPNPEKLVSYFGLNPSVYQSGPTPARHGHITKRGRSYARGLLVEAAWGAAQASGPLRAFFLRVRDRRGQQVAIVATARKLAVIVWYVLTRNEPFAWGRPALTAHKLRALELQSGMPAQHGPRKGPAAAHSLKGVRDQERAVAEQAERTYQRLFSRWKQARPKGREAPVLWPGTPTS